jgi:hypothetical protein
MEHNYSPFLLKFILEMASLELFSRADLELAFDLGHTSSKD